MYITGWDGHNYYHGPQGVIDRLVVSGGKYINHNVGYTNRCWNDGVSVLAGHRLATEVSISNLIIETWGHGIAVAGSPVEVYGCSILVDVKNDLYSFPSGNSCYSSLGIGGIYLAWSRGGSIHDNYIIAGSDNEGASIGISLSYTKGRAEDPFEIYNNYIDVHRGPDDAYDGVTAKGYKQRWSNRYIHIHDNTFKVSTHSNHPTAPQAYGPLGEGIDMYWINRDYGSEGPGRDSFVVIENNRIETNAMDATARGTGIRIAVRNSDPGDPYTFRGAGNIIRNNYWGVTTTGIEFGKGDGGEASTVMIMGDTINFTGVPGGDFHTYEVGDYSGPSLNDTVLDLVYGDSASPTDVYWDPSTPYAYGSELVIQRTLEIIAEGTNNFLIDNAACTVKNTYGEVVLTGTTNARGYWKGAVTYHHMVNDNGTPLDTNFNDFTVTVNSSGTRKDTTLTVDWDTDTIFVPLPKTGIIPKGTATTVSPSITIDSVQNDYDAEWDSVQIHIITDATIGYDSIFMAWDTSTQYIANNYPDSVNGGNTFRRGYTPSTDFDTTITLNMTEIYSLYVSVWTWDAVSGWSDRTELVKNFFILVHHGLTVLDTTSTTFTVIDSFWSPVHINYRGNYMIGHSLYWSTSSDMSSKDSVVLIYDSEGPQLKSPDTMQVTGLSAGTKYYYYWSTDDYADGDQPSHTSATGFPSVTTKGGINSPTTATVDSISNDFAGEMDYVGVQATSSSDVGYDSLLLGWSTSGYPDSSTGDGYSWFNFTPSTVFRDTVTINGAETYMLYLSSWQYQDGLGWSSRTTAVDTFTVEDPVESSSGTIIKDGTIIKNGAIIK